MNNINLFAGKKLFTGPVKRPALAAVIFVILTGLSALASATSDGTALAEKLYNRPDGKDAASRATMVLASKDNKPRYRTLYTYRTDKENGETWSLTRFTEPSDINGTGLLTLDLPHDDSNQWIYLPALDRARRISSSRKGGRFVGSDIVYEDLSKRDVAKDKHRILGEGKVGNNTTTLLENTPLDPDDSVYSKRVNWVHMKTLIPLQTDYYTAGKDKPVKRLKVNKIQKIQGFWTVIDSSVYDLESGHQTRIVTRAIKYDQQLPDSLFSRQSLSDTRLEQQYRP